MKNKHLRILTVALVFSLCAAPLTVAQAGSLSSQEADIVSTGRTAAEDTDLTAAEETGVAATEETDISSSQKTASISSAADNETAQNAETAFREFLDESRSLIWHNDNVTFHFISQKNFDTGSLPLLAMLFEVKEPLLLKNQIYCVMYYDPDDDKIHLSFAEDLWAKSRIRINKNGIITDMASLSAFETFYVYQQLTGNGDVEIIYTSFYDNRKVYLSDLEEREKDVHLAVYKVPDKTGTYYTLRRFFGGDPTFVIDTYLDLTEKNPAAALYMEDLEEGAQLVDHPTVIAAVLESMNKLGVTPEAFFADEPEWTVYETKE